MIFVCHGGRVTFFDFFFENQFFLARGVRSVRAVEIRGRRTAGGHTLPF
jgi:hypothetical protein